MTVLAGLVLAGTVGGLLLARGGGDDGASAVNPPDQDRARLDLASALLTVSDLPIGWNAVDPGRHVADTTILCGREFSPPEEPMAEAKAVFRQTTVGGIVSQRLTAYSGDGADEVMDEFATAVSGCSEWTEKREGEPGQKYSVTQLSFPEIGDETIALEFATTVPAEAPVTVRSHLVMIRRDNVVDLIGYVGTPARGTDAGQTEHFARLADEKLQRVA